MNNSWILLLLGVSQVLIGSESFSQNVAKRRSKTTVIGGSFVDKYVTTRCVKDKVDADAIFEVVWHNELLRYDRYTDKVEDELRKTRLGLPANATEQCSEAQSLQNGNVRLTFGIGECGSVRKSNLSHTFNVVEVQLALFPSDYIVRHEAVEPFYLFTVTCLEPKVDKVDAAASSNEEVATLAFKMSKNPLITMTSQPRSIKTNEPVQFAIVDNGLADGESIRYQECALIKAFKEDLDNDDFRNQFLTHGCAVLNGDIRGQIHFYEIPVVDLNVKYQWPSATVNISCSYIRCVSSPVIAVLNRPLCPHATACSTGGVKEPEYEELRHVSYGPIALVHSSLRQVKGLTDIVKNDSNWLKNGQNALEIKMDVEKDNTPRRTEVRIVKIHAISLHIALVIGFICFLIGVFTVGCIWLISAKSKSSQIKWSKENPSANQCKVDGGFCGGRPKRILFSLLCKCKRSNLLPPDGVSVALRPCGAESNIAASQRAAEEGQIERMETTPLSTTNI